MLERGQTKLSEKLATGLVGRRLDTKVLFSVWQWLLHSQYFFVLPQQRGVKHMHKIMNWIINTHCAWCTYRDQTVRPFSLSAWKAFTYTPLTEFMSLWWLFIVESTSSHSSEGTTPLPLKYGYTPRSYMGSQHSSYSCEDNIIPSAGEYVDKHIRMTKIAKELSHILEGSETGQC